MVARRVPGRHVHRVDGTSSRYGALHGASYRSSLDNPRRRRVGTRTRYLWLGLGDARADRRGGRVQVPPLPARQRRVAPAFRGVVEEASRRVRRAVPPPCRRGAERTTPPTGNREGFLASLPVAGAFITESTSGLRPARRVGSNRSRHGMTCLVSGRRRVGRAAWRSARTPR